MFERLRTDPRALPAFASLASAGALATAYGSQYLGGLQPCILCLYQRVPFWLVLVLGAVGAVLAARGRRDAARWLVVICGLAFLAGAGIAFFHVGVEQHWWAGTDTCAAPIMAAASLEELRAQLAAAPIVRCDDIPFELFGISFAGFNVMASLALAALCGWGAGGTGRAERPSS